MFVLSCLDLLEFLQLVDQEFEVCRTQDLEVLAAITYYVGVPVHAVDKVD